MSFAPFKCFSNCRMDLLTVLTHEIGHLLGLNHNDAGESVLMSESLYAGTRLSSLVGSERDEPVITTPVYSFSWYVRYMLTDANLLINERGMSPWHSMYYDYRNIELSLTDTVQLQR